MLFLIISTFFSDLGDGSLDLSIIWEHVPSMVTSNENASILRVPSYNEVRDDF